MWTFEVHVVDRFIDVKQEYFSSAIPEYVWLSEIYDASTVDEQKQFDLIIHLRFLNTCKELSVSGDWIHLELYVLAAEEFLIMAGVQWKCGECRASPRR